jgi:aldose 1-epimerase
MIPTRCRAPLALISLLILICVFPSGTFAQTSKEAFGMTTDHSSVEIYTLKNRSGMEARIMTYGAALVSLKVPDRNGKFDDIVLGFDNLEGYLSDTHYFGAIVGRYGNRIAKGRFSLNGVEYKLAVNNGENHLHGGLKGFDKVIWTARPFHVANGEALALTYLSKNGEEGYPGNLSVRVVYTLTDKNELRIAYSASTDKDTVLNLTHHSYFNLAGQGNGDVLGQELTINADRFTPTDSGAIPTGDLQPVEGTPFDFRKPTVVGLKIGDQNEQLKFGNGYDHNFVLNGETGVMKNAATLVDHTSGRVMEVSTTEPGVQFYTGNYLEGTPPGKSGKVYHTRYAICLETQHFPDSPNHPKFPTTVLKKNGEFRSATVYRFSVEPQK